MKKEFRVSYVRRSDIPKTYDADAQVLVRYASVTAETPGEAMLVAGTKGRVPFKATKVTVAPFDYSKKRYVKVGLLPLTAPAAEVEEDDPSNGPEVSDLEGENISPATRDTPVYLVYEYFTSDDPNPGVLPSISETQCECEEGALDSEGETEVEKIDAPGTSSSEEDEGGDLVPSLTAVIVFLGLLVISAGVCYHTEVFHFFKHLFNF